jgi:hypothetical protein
MPAQACRCRDGPAASRPKLNVWHSACQTVLHTVSSATVCACSVLYASRVPRSLCPCLHQHSSSGFRFGRAGRKMAGTRAGQAASILPAVGARGMTVRSWAGCGVRSDGHKWRCSRRWWRQRRRRLGAWIGCNATAHTQGQHVVALLLQQRELGLHGCDSAQNIAHRWKDPVRKPYKFRRPFKSTVTIYNSCADVHLCRGHGIKTQRALWSWCLLRWFAGCS